MLDIYQLDNTSHISDEEAQERAWEAYQEALLKQFRDSPEGQTRLQADQEMGFWAASLMRQGHSNLGASLPGLAACEVRDIVTVIFPRKVSIASPDDADAVILELVAFWQYLKRVYNLPNAEDVLRFLHRIEPEFKGIMNDPANFGMAKSFLAAGRAAGFDMTKEEDLLKFQLIHNSTIAQRASPLPPVEHLEYLPHIASHPTSRTPKSKKKRLRKMAEASRKKNRSKRK